MTNDERYYARVIEELKQKGPIPGLWAKSFAEANGNDSRAQALYLKYRVLQLRAEEGKPPVTGALVRREAGPRRSSLAPPRPLSRTDWTFLVSACLVVAVMLACAIFL